MKRMSSSEDEDIDVESPSTKRKRKAKPGKMKRRKVEDKKNTKIIESPSSSGSSKRQHQSPTTSSHRSGYKIPDELELDSQQMASSVQKYVEKLSQGLGLVASVQNKSPSSKKKKNTQKKDSDSSGEEERWLDAIQSGKLEEVDEELKKVKPKDPKLMTARQRAMLERKSDKDPGEQLLALPSGYKEVVMTAEAMERKALKSRKRKEKADEKREKDKKKTMERLLKKQESKSIRGCPKRSSRRNWPQITYRSTVDGPRIDLPPGVLFPLTQKTAVQSANQQMCAVKGCANPKRYSCGKTGVFLCSLDCYKKNIHALVQQVVS